MLVLFPALLCTALEVILVSYHKMSCFSFLLCPYVPFYINSLAPQFYFRHCLKQFAKLFSSGSLEMEVTSSVNKNNFSHIVGAIISFSFQMLHVI